MLNQNFSNIHEYSLNMDLIFIFDVFMKFGTYFADTYSMSFKSLIINRALVFNFSFLSIALNFSPLLTCRHHRHLVWKSSRNHLHQKQHESLEIYHILEIGYNNQYYMPNKANTVKFDINYWLLLRIFDFSYWDKAWVNAHKFDELKSYHDLTSCEAACSSRLFKSTITVHFF